MPRNNWDDFFESFSRKRSRPYSWDEKDKEEQDKKIGLILQTIYWSIITSIIITTLLCK